MVITILNNIYHLPQVFAPSSLPSGKSSVSSHLSLDRTHERHHTQRYQISNYNLCEKLCIKYKNVFNKTGSCDYHMTQRKTLRRSRFHVCVRGIVLLATLRDTSIKQAEERAHDL